MNDLWRRALAYGVGAVVAGGLIWAGFIREVGADLGTVLSSLDTQLRLAHAIPGVDKQGRPLPARQEMLADAAELIDQAAAMAPRMACIEEYRGFLAKLEGRHRDAAACYRRARGMEECDSDMRDTLVFNEARMLHAAGDPSAALAVLGGARDMQARWRGEQDLYCARLMLEMGRPTEASARLTGVIGAAAEAPMTAVRAGQLLEEMARPEEAEKAYQAVAAVSGVGTYRLAVLKLRLNQTDSSLELLESAARSAPAEVRRLVQQDRQAWQVLAADERVRQLLEPTQHAGPTR